MNRELAARVEGQGRSDLSELAPKKQTPDKSKNVIVIPTHRTGTKLLENLLASFHGYSEYPVLIVISDYSEGDRKAFSSIINSFSKLPISLETIETNSFELGGTLQGLQENGLR